MIRTAFSLRRVVRIQLASDHPGLFFSTSRKFSVAGWTWRGSRSASSDGASFLKSLAAMTACHMCEIPQLEVTRLVLHPSVEISAHTHTPHLRARSGRVQSVSGNHGSGSRKRVSGTRKRVSGTWGASCATWQQQRPIAFYRPRPARSHPPA